MVGEVFHSVASSYDIMNDVMSAGVHRLWKDWFVDELGPMRARPGQPSARVLDVAGGTGDIARRIRHLRVAALVTAVAAKTREDAVDTDHRRFLGHGG